MYPHVTQFETRQRELELQLQLLREIERDRATTISTREKCRPAPRSVQALATTASQ